MSAIRTTQIDPDPDMIDFGAGQPGFDLLPLDVMRRAAAVRLQEGDATLLNYGYEQGDGFFRIALADFLQEKYGIPVTADSLMTTTGASQTLDLICTLFAREGDTVFVEEPTYFLALRIFADHRLNVVGLPTDENGLDVEALAAALDEQRPAFLYTVPTFHNPAGITLSAARRQQLVSLSRAYDFLVVADEVYHLLDYTETPPAPMAAFINSGRVLSVGSFSKILAPGLRLGWLQAAPPLLEGVITSGVLDSGGGLNPFTSNLVRVVLKRGWQEAHLARLKATYQRRLQVMEAALNRHLAQVARFVTPAGGFYFWLAMPDAVDTADLLDEARAHGVGFRPGVHFSGRGRLRNYMRLSFAFYDEADIEQGVERLGNVMAVVL